MFQNSAILYTLSKVTTFHVAFFSNLITFVSIQLCIDVQIELNINKFSGGWVGEIHFLHLYASEILPRMTNTYLRMLSVAQITFS